MKVSFELKQGYIDIWNEESEEWDRYIKVNKKAVVEEEKKIPEKLKIEQDIPSSNYYIKNEYGTKCGLTKHSKMIAETLNQLIDYLNSKGE